MSFSAQPTGDKKIDKALVEVYRVLDRLKDEIDKKADKKTLDSIARLLSNSEQSLILVRYRKVHEDGVDQIVREYDSNFGVGIPTWVEWDRLAP